ncbi:nuclear transport factor 2 family protein [Streptomyces sp. NPDC052114]|uniref:nuclear transport factor 2 family protein n=1 Tax=unclassified Streptomyces TaxID=2593676 RepID=UPI003430EFBD
MSIETVTDPRRFIEDLHNRYHEDAVHSDEDPATVIDRYYTPDIELRSDGVSMGRERLIKHLRPVRKSVVSGHYEVLDAVRDGNRIAARLIIHGETRAGATEQIEVIEFCEVTDDGRFAKVTALTRPLGD